MQKIGAMRIQTRDDPIVFQQRIENSVYLSSASDPDPPVPIRPPEKVPARQILAMDPHQLVNLLPPHGGKFTAVR